MSALSMQVSRPHARAARRIATIAALRRCHSR
jgi:hypothetical protein